MAHGDEGDRGNDNERLQTPTDFPDKAAGRQRRQSVVKVQRRTETGEAPSWQGGKRENTGSIRPLSNAARGDAAPVECSGAVTTGCQAETAALGDAIAELAARMQAATYELLVLIHQFDERDGWGQGFMSCAHWLRGPVRNYDGIRPPMHPAQLRCSLVEYCPVFSRLSPC